MRVVTVGKDRFAIRRRSFCGIKIEEKFLVIDHDLEERFEFIVGRELFGSQRLEAQYVARVDRHIVVRADDLAITACIVSRTIVRIHQRSAHWQGLGARDGVVAGPAVQEVVAQTAVDHVVGILRIVKRLLEATARFHRR